MTDGIYDETPSEETARLNAAAAARKASVDARIAALEDESFGDGLRSTVSVLLNPGIANYSTTQRMQDIVTCVLGMVANRELDREAAA